MSNVEAPPNVRELARRIVSRNYSEEVINAFGAVMQALGPKWRETHEPPTPEEIKAIVSGGRELHE